MKKIALFALSFLTVSGCNSDDQSNPCGTYQGLLPAASGPGISMTIELKKDKTFKNKLVYIDENESTFFEKGNYNISNGIIELKSNDEISYYKYEDGNLKLLDYQKNEIESEFADMYILRRMGTCK